MRVRLLFSVIGLCVLSLLTGCSGEFVYRKDIERLSKPGALDMPLSRRYDTYQYKLLDKYQITHQWTLESDCKYGKIRTERVINGIPVTFYEVVDIYEANGSTWQRYDVGSNRHYNFDRFVRAEYLSGPNGYGNYRTEKGYNPICFESWWTTSNYIRLRLQKRSLDELVKVFTERYPEGDWSNKTVNNQTWRVQETPESKFRTRPLNGVGGPYQSWLIPLGDTGYTMAMELGASKESLQYPEAHARMQAMFKHLIESVKIEPIRINSTKNTPQTTSAHESTCNPDDHNNLPLECQSSRLEASLPQNKHHQWGQTRFSWNWRADLRSFLPHSFARDPT
jgi:hypothetical protein